MQIWSNSQFLQIPMYFTSKEPIERLGVCMKRNTTILMIVYCGPCGSVMVIMAYLHDLLLLPIINKEPCESQTGRLVDIGFSGRQLEVISAFFLSQ